MALMTTLVDSFNDNSRDTAKWPTDYITGSGVTVSETGGQMVISLVNAAGSNYAGWTSNTYNLTGSQAAVQLATVPIQTDTHVEMFMEITLDTANIYKYDLVNGTFQAFKVVGGSLTQVGSNLTYNASLHRWWRIRESGGTTFWDVSADGVIWTNHTSVANAFTLTALTVTLHAGTWATVANPGQAMFDNFNLPPRATFNSPGLRPHPFSPGLAR